MVRCPEPGCPAWADVLETYTLASTSGDVPHATLLYDLGHRLTTRVDP